MSAWHDPRDRLVVDGYGKTIGRSDRWRVPQWPATWAGCIACGGTSPRYSAPNTYDGFIAPHSCRPERHQ